MNNAVISFFAGAGGLDTGFEQAGFHIPWANEFDKKITPTLQANHPDTQVDDRNLFDIPSSDIPDNPVGIVGGPPCFPAGHQVLTKDGFKDIAEISIGDFVMTHTGQYKEVFDFGTQIAPTIDVKIFGGLKIRSTPGHPFYVVERTIKFKENWKEKTTYLFSEPHWLEASQLTSNHFVISPLDTLNQISHYNLSEEEAYFIGRWVGDGWLRKTSREGTYGKTLKNGKILYRKSGFKKTIYICCAKEEKEQLEPIFQKMFDTFHTAEQKTAFRFGGYSSRLFKILEEFGNGASNKSFPAWVFSEPLEIQQKFLSGYLDSDGSYHDGQYNITTVSPKLALGVQRLVRNIHRINPNITKFVRPAQTIIEGRTVNQKNTYQIRWYVNGNKSTTFFHENFMYSKVFAVDTLKQEEQVYNFSVRDDESYTINNFAVHNCQSWSLGGLGKGLDDKRGQVFLEYIRVIRDKQPKFFLAENVKGILAKSRKKDLDVIIQAFADLNYHFDYKLVNARDYGVPEDRWRVIFVGYHESIGKPFTFPEPTSKLLTLQDAIWDLRDTAVKAQPNGNPNPEADNNHEYLTGGFSSQYMSRNRVRSWNEPSFTIQASGRQAPIHPDSPKMIKVSQDAYQFADENYRRLTIREAARIQTFPDDYKFLYNKAEYGYKMIGNAVPVEFSRQIASAIYTDMIKQP